MKVLGIIGTAFGTKSKIALETLKINEMHDFETADLRDYNLPYADGRVLMDHDEKTRDLLNKIMDADALVIAMPVFQASMPGILKNLLDLIPMGGLENKIMGLIITAGSQNHYLVGEYQVLPIFKYMKANVIDKYVFITQTSYYKDSINDDGIILRLDSLSKTIDEKLNQMPKWDF